MAYKVIARTKSILNVPTYKSRLDMCFDNICVDSDIHSMSMDLCDGYKVLKDASATLCGSNKNVFYNRLKNRMIDCEDLASGRFIVPDRAIFNPADFRFAGKNIFSIDRKELIEYIVWFTRSRLLATYEDDNSDEIIDFNKLHFTNDCKFAANVIKMVCDTLKVPCEVVKLPPAFTDEFQLYKGNGFHYFCFLTIDGVKYLVDPTYKQFFTLDFNLKDRLGVMGLNGCNPGIYMLMNNSRRKTAINILRKGYVVATDENIKNYLDGFLLSYRNGLFYERYLGEANYDVPYSITEYFEFINGDELLFDYEPIDFMGNQEEPLKNKNFRF